ncbi:uncharacterized protein CELE_Y102E9.5 [Caenorhabditis elegans]|uniref:Uncharacterized protein n=1 Tax=Caenorhabditis elegans TaxID=6239 RepID=A0A679L8T0_CAEEL|nr:Uncharacterized protein CELE_Y102E9.5 [Caenorhabditis elegans]CAA9991443.1 Uncharacterized protein CELE_Y102E9.5 [Caenorhabditis elegans]
MTLLIASLLVTLLVIFEQISSVGTHISSNSLSSKPKRYEYNSQWCKGPIDGDCNPYNCGGGCESKYIRFYDQSYKMDRTIKSCFCQQERLCSILGMHAFSGCKSYYQLSSVAQKFVRDWLATTLREPVTTDTFERSHAPLRFWSMDNLDRKNRHSNNVRHRYSDKTRHFQLINGRSRFCCRATAQKRLALHLKSSSLNFKIILVLLPIVYPLIY